MFKWLQELDFLAVGKRELYQLFVKTDYYEDINHRCDTKQKEYLMVPDDLVPSCIKVPFQNVLETFSGENYIVLPTNMFVSITWFQFCTISETV